jgi:hypothetical protein
VSALNGVSLQRRTPVAASLSARTLSERGDQGEKWRVRKTPFLAGSQVRETTRSRQAILGVRKRTVFDYCQRAEGNS